MKFAPPSGRNSASETNILPYFDMKCIFTSRSSGISVHNRLAYITLEIASFKSPGQFLKKKKLGEIKINKYGRFCIMKQNEPPKVLPSRSLQFFRLAHSFYFFKILPSPSTLKKKHKCIKIANKSLVLLLLVILMD